MTCAERSRWSGPTLDGTRTRAAAANARLATFPAAAGHHQGRTRRSRRPTGANRGRFQLGCTSRAASACAPRTPSSSSEESRLSRSGATAAGRRSTYCSADATARGTPSGRLRGRGPTAHRAGCRGRSASSTPRQPRRPAPTPCDAAGVSSRTPAASSSPASAPIVALPRNPAWLQGKPALRQLRGEIS
jgi:hypothetical protein